MERLEAFYRNIYTMLNKMRELREQPPLPPFPLWMGADNMAELRRYQALRPVLGPQRPVTTGPRAMPITLSELEAYERLAHEHDLKGEELRAAWQSGWRQAS